MLMAGSSAPACANMKRSTRCCATANCYFHAKPNEPCWTPTVPIIPRPMKIEIRDCCLRDVSYTAAHALEIDRQEILACGPNTMFEAACLTWAALQANGGIAYTGFRDGNPELVCGFTRQSAITPWLFSAWMWSTKNALPCIPELVRHCRKELWARLVEDLGATRTEARSHIGHLNAHRFLKGIGFVREADLVDYGRARSRFVLFAMRLSDFQENGHLLWRESTDTIAEPAAADPRRSGELAPAAVGAAEGS